MKYWRIEAYTPYCGETYTCYEEAESIHELNERIGEAIYECACEWQDGDTIEDDFDGDFDEYVASCGADIYEITKEEYEREVYLSW